MWVEVQPMELFFQWVPTLIAASFVATIFLARNWFVARIKSGVEHDFNAKLEGLKSELRSRESEISSLRNAVLTAQNQRHALVEKRKIEAVEYLWRGVVELQKFRPHSNAMAAINLDVVEKEASDFPGTRKFFEQINSLAPKPGDLKPNEAVYHRPFISNTAWAYYSAIYTIVYGVYMRAKALEIGVKNFGKYLKVESEKRIIRAALPHQEQFIEKYDAFSYSYLIDELEDALLKELRIILDGSESDQESVRRASKIESELKKISSENA